MKIICIFFCKNTEKNLVFANFLHIFAIGKNFYSLEVTKNR